MRKNIFIIGHRGSGKSTLLQAISKASPAVLCFDLDAEIEKRTGKSIPKIFAEEGEAEFRELEKKVLDNILRQAQDERVCFVTLGAGFSGPLPQNAKVVWIRRDSDSKGRIFLARPSLGRDQLSGFAERFAEREMRYAELADEIITLPEGNYSHAAAINIFNGQVQNCGGFITILPEQIKSPQKFKAWLQSRLSFGFDFFELRDDLLSLEEIQFCLQHIPPEKALLSFRIQNSPALTFAKDYKIDWEIELGKCPVEKPFIRSSHQRFSNEASKVAVPVNSFAELLAGHKWQQDDPCKRSFLPISPDGRWKWYRLLMKNRMAINFIREGKGSNPDQPTLIEWLAMPNKVEKFYAVLGDPIAHSFSPEFHREFFAKHNIASFGIKISQEEWDEALPILQELGLRFASVTSPLKSAAANLLGLNLESINTLAWNERLAAWQGTNTDTPVIEMTLKNIAQLHDIQNKIVVWGGGGMLPVLSQHLSHVSYYAARTGELRKGEAKESPSILVWAAGSLGDFPPEAWKPRYVIDLDYRQDAKGLQYAEKVGASYVSGLAFFELQAKLQQEYWSKHVR